MSGLSGQYPLADLLECAGLARSSYYYALSHPKAPTRPELWEAAAEIFSRTANGCGHRQIAMCLRAEQGVRIADKTTLKMMREMGISCGIRREMLASIYFSPFSPTYFRQSRQRGCAGFANADAPLSASRLPPPSRPHRRWIRPSGGTTVPLS